MKLTVIDTPGFGDQINNENWYVSAWALSALKTTGRRWVWCRCIHLRTTCALHAEGCVSLKDGRGV